MRIENTNGIKGLDNEKQEKAIKEWESYFIHTLLKEMRKTIPKSELFGNDSFATEIYYDMLDKQMAESIAENGGMGFAKSMMKNMFKQQVDTVRKQQIGDIYKENTDI